MAITLPVFFIWTYPANVATQNWTVQPADWAELRRQWGYSHAFNAFLMFAAFCFVALRASLSAGERYLPRPPELASPGLRR